MNSIPSATSLISRASIFLPRYSGVRPTISPAMKTASRTNSSIAVEAGADAAEDDLAGRHVRDRHGAAEPGERLERRVDRAVRGGRGHGRPQRRELAIPKRCSLPSRLPPVEPLKCVRADAGEVLRRRAVLLGGVRDRDAETNSDRHRREDRPALPAAADHPPVGRRQRRRDQQDREQLDEVREARRVLERHRGVDVEEPAAVGPELLDRSPARRRGRTRSSARRPASVCAVAEPAKVWITPCETSSSAPTIESGSRM